VAGWSRIRFFRINDLVCKSPPKILMSKKLASLPRLGGALKTLAALLTMFESPSFLSQEEFGLWGRFLPASATLKALVVTISRLKYLRPKATLQALKRESIFSLRGPEGPLFHSGAYIREFFRSLPGCQDGWRAQCDTIPTLIIDSKVQGFRCPGFTN